MDPARTTDRVRIAEIDAQIAALERSLHSLRSEKELAQARLDAYVYPVLTLPNEIASEIFIECVPKYPQSADNVRKLPCRFLHSGVPSIRSWKWDDIPVHFFESWLSLSDNRPLSLEICGNLNPSWIDVLLAHRARWQHFRIWEQKISLRFLDNPMPLRSLSVSLDASVVVEIHDVPLLRAVHIAGLDPLYDVGLPWAQLTSLRLEGAWIDDYTHILQETQNLTHCEIERAKDEEGIRQLEIHLPRLDSLLFTKVDLLATDSINSFIVPALRMLQVPEFMLGSDPIDTLKGFISKSGCALQEVRIMAWKEVPLMS
ncbi:hypothetical protein B0H14DRAFT_3693493 [Mycena olivaceomarginata]|nr:hypothetical protein B0H14DRAFT_3693493 [Mycena olivaceomarginata]